MPTRDGFLGPETGLLIVSYMVAAMSDQVLAACAEFPNDNPGLHLGAIWYCGEVTGGPVCELPFPIPVPLPCSHVDPPTDPTPPVLEADDAVDDIEIGIRCTTPVWLARPDGRMIAG